jgi:hypothetical protein
MLGSITPLGERSRRSRWGSTVGAYVLGSAIGGAAVGGALGALGTVLAPSGTAALWLLCALIVGGILFDAGSGRWDLPTVRRQVNESWLHRYRGWVYGAGFGLQLGAGVVTVVVASAVYVAFAAAFLSASPTMGSAIGVAFGSVRAATLLPAAAIQRPTQLGRIDARLRAWDGRARWIAVACQVALAAACVAVAVG